MFYIERSKAAKIKNKVFCFPVVNSQNRLAIN